MRGRFEKLRGKAKVPIKMLRPSVDQLLLSSAQMVYGNTTLDWGWVHDRYKHVETAGDILMFKPGSYHFLMQLDFESLCAPSGVVSDFASMQVRFDGNHFTLFTWNQKVYQCGRQSLQFQFPHELFDPTNIKVFVDWDGSEIRFNGGNTNLFVTYYEA